MSESANKEDVYPSYPKKITPETPYIGSAFLPIGDFSFHSSKPVGESGISVTTCYGIGSFHPPKNDFLVNQQPVLFFHLMRQKNREIAFLNRKIGEMKNRIELLEQKIGSIPEMAVEHFVELDDDQMRKKIIDYYHTHEVVYPSDIAFEMNFDLKKVVKIINNLITSGEVEEVTEQP